MTDLPLADVDVSVLRLDRFATHDSVTVRATTGGALDPEPLHHCRHFLILLAAVDSTFGLHVSPPFGAHS